MNTDQSQISKTSLSPRRIFTTLALLGVAFVCGCRTGRHYVRGQGDVGHFIIQHALAFGGHPVTTNGLPAIGGEWQYIQDEYGVGILLPRSQYQPVQDFVRAAFGPPSNSAGWAVRDFGVAIGVQPAGTNTVIGINPPMSAEKLARGLRQTIPKGPR